MPTNGAGALSAELEAATLRALRVSWDDLNWNFFRQRLRPPTFALSDAETRLGRWEGGTRTLEIARVLLLDHGWGAVVEVLKHEMAHQYVDEVLGCRDETSHGQTFRKVCAERNFDARASGAPGPTDGTADPGPEGRVLERIAKLLALAESPNEHEAQSAMNAAQRLMLKHNLESVSRGQTRWYGYRHLGIPTGRVEEHWRILAAILREHFFVETLWVPVWRPLEGRRATVLEVCGTADNLEMAAYVHSFLGHTAEALWTLHRRARKIRSNRDRRPYLAGVMAGFREKLDAQRKTDDAMGLVWLGDPALGSYLKQRHPHVRTIRHGRSDGHEAHAHGREAGKGIVLRRGVGGAAPAGGRLLGPGD